MTAAYRVLLRADATREQWLAARRQGIGGSDAPAVLGVGGYHTALEVYTSKVTDLPEDNAGEAASWGQLLEDVVAREWARREGMAVRRGPALVQSTRWPWMVASVDRLACRPGSTRPVGVYEGKLRTSWVARAWDDGVPADVVVQCLHYCAVYDLPVAYVACLVGGAELRTYTVHAERTLIDDIVEEERRWWESYVLPRRLPPLTRDDSNASALARLFPAPEGAVELDLDAVELLRQRRKADEAYKAAKAERDEIDDRIRLLLADKVEGHINGVKFVAWTPSDGSRSTDFDLLQRDYPDAYAACVKRGEPTRRLNFSRKEIPTHG